MKMQFEMLLNVYLTWQLLLKQIIRFFRHLSPTLPFCSRRRVKGEPSSARGIGQVLTSCFQHHIGCEGGLHRQVGWDRGVGQGGAVSGSCRKCNNWGERAEKADRIEGKISVLCYCKISMLSLSALCMQSKCLDETSFPGFTFWLHLSIYIAHVI